LKACQKHSVNIFGLARLLASLSCLRRSIPQIYAEGGNSFEAFAKASKAWCGSSRAFLQFPPSGEP